MTSKTAALLIIGNEILSGRTQDANLNHLALKLSGKGIALSEVRVVRDEEAAIVDAVDALRVKYDYLFTTGGIGPTHDDITIASIAHALRVPVVEHPDAYDALVKYYGDVELVTEARRRMAQVPQGASLIDNPVSGAPGVRVENIIIMAGVPKIMQAMLDAVLPTLEDGPLMHSVTVIVEKPESVIAKPLAGIAAQFPDVEIGSYPQYREGKYSVALVARGTDEKVLANVEALLKAI